MALYKCDIVNALQPRLPSLLEAWYDAGASYQAQEQRQASVAGTMI
jgi:hypothetical protein